MTVLFGHPTGNPNSHHAALAHLEAGRLEAFCVPWMPSQFSIRLLGHFGVLRPLAQRLSRRRFPPLDVAPKIQGRIGEFRRLLTRAMGRGDERLSYQANDWLMKTMRRECRRAKVSAVHSYEECSLWQFVEAKRRGKACIYDMPIGYYPVWEQTQTKLARQYIDWLPAGGLQSSLLYEHPDKNTRRWNWRIWSWFPVALWKKLFAHSIRTKGLRRPSTALTWISGMCRRKSKNGKHCGLYMQDSFLFGKVFPYCLKLGRRRPCVTRNLS